MACLPGTATKPVAHADKERDDDSRYIDHDLNDGDDAVVVKCHGVFGTEWCDDRWEGLSSGRKAEYSEPKSRGLEPSPET